MPLGAEVFQETPAFCEQQTLAGKEIVLAPEIDVVE
jgi:hypothetical protein